MKSSRVRVGFVSVWRFFGWLWVHDGMLGGKVGKSAGTSRPGSLFSVYFGITFNCLLVHTSLDYFS